MRRDRHLKDFAETIIGISEAVSGGTGDYAAMDPGLSAVQGVQTDPVLQQIDAGATMSDHAAMDPRAYTGHVDAGVPQVDPIVGIPLSLWISVPVSILMPP